MKGDAAAASAALLGGKSATAAPPIATIEPGTLTILSAYPDPPFEVLEDGVATGFDI